MNRHVIELMNNIRNDAYKLGYIEGTNQANFENEKENKEKNESFQKELLILRQRVSWLHDKLTRTKENYEGQINNLQNKIKYYEGLCHIADKYTDMKGE